MNQQHRHWRLVGAVGGIVALSLVACGGPGTAANSSPTSTASAINCAPLQATQKLTVGVTDTLSVATPFVAYGYGYFKQENLDVTLQTVTDGTLQATLIASGQLDAGENGIGASFYNGLASGLPLHMVGSSGELVGNPPSGGLFVSTSAVNSGKITKVSDLRGVTIGSPAGKGSSVEFLVGLILKQGGLTAGDVNWTTVPLASLPTAFKNGAIEAAWDSAPLTSLLTPDIAQRIGNQAVMDGQTQSGPIIGRRLTYDTQVGCAFMRAMIKAQRQLQGNFQQDPQFVNNWVKLTGQTAASVEGSPQEYFDPNLKENPSTFSGMQQTYMSEHLLNYSKMLTYNQIVDQPLLDAALNSLKTRP